MLIRFVLFGMLGLVGALIVNALKRSLASRRLELCGEASLLFFPLFGLGAFLFPIVAVHVSKLPWYGRGAIYMAMLFLLQYLLGLLLRRIHLCPWSASGKGSLGGLIHIADAPIWFGVGLGIEYAYPWIKAAAIALH